MAEWDRALTGKGDQVTTEVGHLQCPRCHTYLRDDQYDSTSGVCRACTAYFGFTSPRVMVTQPAVFTAPALDPSTAVRTFASGATRDTDDTKVDYNGFLHPLTVKAYGDYMNRHRHLKDGTVRASTNWTAGIPRAAYVQSLMRHVEDVRRHQHGYPEAAVEPLEEALCAAWFNIQGLLLEVLLKRDVKEDTCDTSR